ncbi:MAG TPA: hypothetical protein DCX03_02455 [Bacteroidales bacterium]|nr:hypothetical protein [Bacteroidales bacterium]
MGSAFKSNARPRGGETIKYMHRGAKEGEKLVLSSPISSLQAESKGLFSPYPAFNISSIELAC